MFFLASQQTEDEAPAMLATSETQRAKPLLQVTKVISEVESFITKPNFLVLSS